MANTQGNSSISNSTTGDCDVEAILLLLNSTNLRDRDLGLSRIAELVGNEYMLFRVRPECAKAERIRTALITLLNQVSREEPVQGEGRAEYVDYLITLVASLDDDKSLSLFLGPYFGANRSVEYYLAKKGDITLDSVLTKLSIQGYPGKTMCAIRILGIMLEPKTEGFVARGATKALLIERLIDLAKSSSQPGIRRPAVRALSQSQDEQLIPFITFISENDPHYTIAKDGERHYWVREEAQQALKKLEANR